MELMLKLTNWLEKSQKTFVSEGALDADIQLMCNTITPPSTDYHSKYLLFKLA